MVAQLREAKLAQDIVLNFHEQPTLEHGPKKRLDHGTAGSWQSENKSQNAQTDDSHQRQAEVAHQKMLEKIRRQQEDLQSQLKRPSAEEARKTEEQRQAVRIRHQELLKERRGEQKHRGDRRVLPQQAVEHNLEKEKVRPQQRRIIMTDQELEQKLLEEEELQLQQESKTLSQGLASEQGLEQDDQLLDEGGCQSENSEIDSLQKRLAELRRQREDREVLSMRRKEDDKTQERKQLEYQMRRDDERRAREDELKRRQEEETANRRQREAKERQTTRSKHHEVTTTPHEGPMLWLSMGAMLGLVGALACNLVTDPGE
jgi:hypothetical protein